MKELCIVCPYRNRPEFLKDFTSHFSVMYPEAEIIIVEQCDSNKFVRGQLCNLGFKESVKDLFLFIDVDLRFKRVIDLLEISKRLSKPFYPYNVIEHCMLVGDRIYKKTNQKEWKNSPGGAYVFTREQYITVNGHSNLFIGHSYEDSDIRERAGLQRHSETIIHLYHQKCSNLVDINQNKTVYEGRAMRDVQEDGVLQTQASQTIIECLSKNIKKVKVSNIGVCHRYKYNDILKRKYE